MDINKQIVNDLKVIGAIIADSSYYFGNLEVLVTQLEQNEKEVFNGYPFLKRTKMTLWSLVLLDLNKVLSNRNTDKYRFKSILNRIENNYQKVQWMHVLTKKDIVELKNLINLESINVLKIKDIRDKRIAHYDDNVDIKTLKLDELRRLVMLCQEIYNKLTYSLQSSSTLWTFISSEMVFPVVNSLTRYHSLRNMVFKSLCDKNELISTNELIKIIRGEICR